MTLFNKTFQESMFRGLTIMEKEASQIASDWNGEDARYISGGDTYTEDDAGQAKDIEDAVRHLINLLDDTNF